MPSSTERTIDDVCSALADFLKQKNKAYGDSALNPNRIFSKADPLEQIRVRIDDKLNRVMQGNEYPGDDTIKDLAGYLVLYMVALRMTQAPNAHPDRG